MQPRPLFVSFSPQVRFADMFKILYKSYACEYFNLFALIKILSADLGRE